MITIAILCILSFMNLKDARRLAGRSQADLAEQAGLHPATYCDIESGRVVEPSYFKVVRIVRALQQCGLKGVTADQLFPVDREQLAS